MQKITSKGQWELYLASIASAFDGKDSSPNLYSMNEANNFRYKIIVKNLTNGLEIQDHIKDMKLSPNRNSSKIQSSKATFSLEEIGLVNHGDKIEVLVRNISETFEIKVLSGKARIENNKLDNYGMLNSNISIMDEVENLYSKVVPEDSFVFDNYLNNDNDKNNSIYHIIMRKIGFKDEDLEIENIINSNGSLIRIPFMLFKEGNRWIDELFTALDSIGARIFITPEGKVRIENGVDKREPKPVYDFTKNNILNSFETKVIYPDKNGSKVIYDNYRYLENQIIFGLAEKVEVKIGTTPETNQKAMRIKYVSDIAKSYNLTKAEGYWYPGEDAASLERVQLVEGVHYKFEELKSSGAVVKFFNPFPKVFYIDVFEISGIPLVKYEGNEYIFKNENVVEKNDENFYSYQNNKYIQEEPLAAEVGKIIFLDKCKENTEYSFKCNFVPFLDIGDICNLNFFEKNELVRITSIEHSLGREKGCTSNIKVQKVIFLSEEEYRNSSLESLNVSTSFLELKNLKEEIKNVEEDFKESEAWITGKIGAKAWISEEQPVGNIKDHDVWYKESTNEFKIWMNGKWNPAAEEDIMPALKSWIATQTAQLEMGKIIEEVDGKADGAYERAGIFLMNNDEKFGSMNGAIAEVSIDKNARILAKNVNNLLEFNTKDPAKPNVMTSKILMGVYDVNDPKHANTAFQVGDEATGNYIKFDMAGGVSNVIGDKDVTEWIEEAGEKADEVQNNLDQGRLTINSNTTFNGDATIVSMDNIDAPNETTVIRGGSITFTRNGEPITVVRNMKFGTIPVDSSTPSVIKLHGFSENVSIMTALKKFEITSEVKEMECYAEPKNSKLGEYFVYLRGAKGVSGDYVDRGTKTSEYLEDDVYGLKIEEIRATGTSPVAKNVIYQGYSTYEETTSAVGGGSAGITITASLSGFNGTSWVSLGQNSTKLTFDCRPSGSNGVYIPNDIPSSITATIVDTTLTSLLKTTMGVRLDFTVRASLTGVSYTTHSMTPPRYKKKTTTFSTTSTLGSKSYRLYVIKEKLVDYVGSGEVQYIAMEV